MGKLCQHYGIGALVAAIAVAGCLPSSNTDSVIGPEDLQKLSEAELVDLWKEILPNAEENMTAPAYFLVADELAKFGPGAFMPLVEIVGDDSYSPRQRVVTVEVLKLNVSPVMIPRLKQFTAKEFDGTTRASAVFLLGLMPNEDLSPFLRTLVDDEERRVAFAAKLGLGNANDPDILEQLRALYWDEDLSSEEKIQIVRLLSVKAKPVDVDLLAHAVNNEEFAEFERAEVAHALGQIGHPDAIPALETCADASSSEALRTVAEAAIAAIQERQSLSPS